jgi:hypothetical protein
VTRKPVGSWQRREAFGRGQEAVGPSTSQDEVWRDADEQLVKRIVIDRQAAPKSYRVLTLNHTTLTAVLNKAPLEFSEESKKAIQLTTGISSMRNTIARL